MQAQAQAVVIGGGLIGCSVLYHLAKLGWTDCILFERDELTSGSTWHAAANIHGLHDTNNISKLQYYTMQLYEELERETEQSCGVYKHGYLYLAASAERAHQLKIQAAKAKMYGVEFYEVGLDEAKRLHPLLNLDGIHCAMYEADAGKVDPSGVTHAYAKGATMRGAKIERFCPVLETNQRADGTWDVVTTKGSVHAQVVVNAAGLWGREVGKLAGLDLPLLPTEHQYFVTESLPQVAEVTASLGRALPSVADRDGEYYLRQEGEGFLVGAYEQKLKFWAEDGTPQDFGHDLLDDDLERIEPNILAAFNRLPALEEAGIKRVINGPMIWSPDANALLGPVPELKNYYCANGIIPGFSQSAGLGLTLAQWIVEGEPELDMFPWDVTRFGAFADKAYTKAKVADSYMNRFKIHFPFEERPAGRPVMTRPGYERQKELGGVFGFSFGYEHPQWYGEPGSNPVDEFGFNRTSWWQPAGDACVNLRENVGLVDVSNFAKYEIKGPNAHAWLDHFAANTIPTEIGRSCLTPLLSARGGIAGDFTITKVDEESYFMIGSGIAERYHQRYFNAVPINDGVEITSATHAYCGFNIAGPKARAVLSSLTDADLSNEGFKFMRSQSATVAGIPALILRVSFTGDLGFEVYFPQDQHLAMLDAILAAGAPHGIKPAGSRSLLSLRVEKGYGSWGREYSPEYWPQEVGLDRLIKLDKKGDFLGRAGYEAIKDNAPRERLVQWTVKTTAGLAGADASGGEPVFLPDGTPVGRVSSGAYGWGVGTSVALGFVKSEHYRPGETYHIAILGESHEAILQAEPVFDAPGVRLRG